MTMRGDAMDGLLSAGVGLKPEHYAEAEHCVAAGLWFEVHPENYMVDGGPRLKWLERIRARYPLSFHGVGLSLAGCEPPDEVHLGRFAQLVRRFEPDLVSEHLAWSMFDGRYRPDLLPVTRTAESLAMAVDNVSRVQDALQRRVSIENPSHYLLLPHDYDEIDFLTELADRSGCALLLDINNVFVSAANLSFDAQRYVDAFPARCVAEVHLAGHRWDVSGLAIDSHDAPVDAAVWALYQRLIDRIGRRPTLIERDGNVPSFEDLMAERRIAHSALKLECAA
jgi:uncharacterized protein (UPF0276 family)